MTISSFRTTSHYALLKRDHFTPLKRESVVDKNPRFTLLKREKMIKNCCHPLLSKEMKTFVSNNIKKCLPLCSTKVYLNTLLSGYKLLLNKDICLLLDTFSGGDGSSKICAILLVSNRLRRISRNMSFRL